MHGLNAARRMSLGAKLVSCVAAICLALPSDAATRISSLPDGIGRVGDGLGSAVALLGDTAAVGASSAVIAPNVPAGVVAIFRENAGSWTSEATIQASDATAQMQFGVAVALAPDMAVVASDSAIYTFSRSGTDWTQIDRFSYQPTVADLSGLSISGDTLIATGGAVFVRQGSGWSLQAQLEGDAAVPTEYFGYSVAIDGDIAVVSSYVPNYPFPSEGYAYFFSRSGAVWSREVKIDLGLGGVGPVAVSGSTALISSGQGVHAFTRDSGVWSEEGSLDPGAPFSGSSLSIEGDLAIVGSPSDSVNGNVDGGTAYVFERSGDVWSRIAHIYDPSYEPLDSGFASSLALDGSNLLVGVPGASAEAGPDSGKAMIFVQDPAWAPAATLTTGSAHANEGFGQGVAASQSSLLVGAPDARRANTLSHGAAYVFDRSPGGWSQAAVLVPTSSETQGFGNSVSLDGDTAVVGAYADDNIGAVYVFTRDTGDWPFQARLIGHTLDYEYFGWSTALVGDVLVAGQPGGVNSYSVGPAGKVYIFGRSGSIWSEQQVVQPDDTAYGDEFGYSLAMSGDTLLVGAPRADTGIETNAGAVYVFVDSGNGWNQQARLVAPIIATDAGFGLSVAIAGDTAIIGAGAEDATMSLRGAAYVYVRQGSAWSWQATLAPTIAPSGSFGHAVAISADASFALVGMPVSTSEAPRTGYTFRFQRDGSNWIPSSTLQGSPPPSLFPDRFGMSLAIDGSEAVVGAPNDGVGGAAYVASVGEEIFSNGFDF